MVSGRLETLTVTIKAMNMGRSPAQIVDELATAQVLPAGQPLPATPPYETGRQGGTAGVPMRWVGPSTEFTTYTYYCGSLASEAPEVFREVREGRKRRVVTGVVRYCDTRSDSVHESRYCYWIFGTAGAGGTMHGPAAYNLLTQDR